MIAPLRCARMIGSAYLQASTMPRRLIDDDAIEGIGRDVFDRRIAARETHPHVVVQDVDASQPLRGSPRSCGSIVDSSVTSTVGVRHATFGFDHRDGFARGLDSMIRYPHPARPRARVRSRSPGRCRSSRRAFVRRRRRSRLCCRAACALPRVQPRLRYRNDNHTMGRHEPTQHARREKPRRATRARFSMRSTADRAERSA